ncbi:ATP-dependent Clp protease adaptor ClpS [Sulfurimonas sp. MAG313]|nr:ATP-dependent Clp protease adaptor ClpS [Sulfurimonas sp. MAG313]MDF1881232.1 ATP-dependent Clp protease adaptor ClpS [Sulfurimonas sp. MAG313]
MSSQLQTRLVNHLDEPKSYIVYMLNDDYTTWDFCLRIICDVFHKTLEEADTITHEIHTKGRGFCGIYVFEIAETKAHTVQHQARNEGFPMKCAIEEK